MELPGARVPIFLRGSFCLHPTRVVTDAKTIQDYYWRRYRKKSEMIAYGAEPPGGSNRLGDFGLPSRRYILYVARLAPENNPELVLRAYRTLGTDWPFAIVGGNTYRPSYVRQLESLADPRDFHSGRLRARCLVLHHNEHAVVVEPEAFPGR